MKFVLTLAFCLGVGLSYSQITSYPYYEDFESGQGGWTINNGSNGSWAFGTPAGSVIIGASSGVNAFGNGNLTGNYLNNDQSWVESPYFDFSSLLFGVNTLSLDVWWSSEFSWDGANIEYSIDSGATWTVLGAFGDPNNWYNDNTIGATPGGTSQHGWTGTGGNSSGGWVTAEHGLPTSLNGEPDVLFRVNFGSDGSGLGNGFAFDNFGITPPPPNEAMLSSIVAPSGSCGLTNAEQVIINVANNGTQPITSLDVCYILNGGSPVCETVATSIAPNAAASITFTSTVDLSTPGSYTLDAYVTLTGDTVNSNDSIFGYSLQSVNLISSFPYLQTFENNDGGWQAAGTANWEWGIPANTIINGTAPCSVAGIRAWVTNLDGAYANNSVSYLISPCFDFSGMTTDPVITFDHIFDLESCCDEGWLEASIDGGTTWYLVGTNGTGLNWYNDPSNQWWDDASSGGWRKAANILNGTAGSSDVRLRFVFSSDVSVTREGFGVDNINIDENLPVVDAMPDGITQPFSSCGMTASEFISFDIVNQGIDTIFSYTACYILDGGTPVCETVSNIILPGSSYNHTFTTTGDFSTIGNHDLTVSVSAPDDLNICNDTMNATVINAPIVSSLPYSEDFETDNGFWTASGTPNWQWGAPAGTIINGTSSCDGGNNAWVTNLTGGYANSSVSYLTSPCFDFSGLSNDPIITFDHIFELESCCDEGWVEISTDGGATWTVLGAVGTGMNWYNDPSNNWWDASSSNGWRTAAHVLTGTAGSSNVRVRFVLSTDSSVQREGFGVDNINIDSNVPLTDGSPVVLNSPLSNCLLTAGEIISADYFNYGVDTIFGFTVCYSIDAQGFVCELVNDTILPNGSYTHTFLTAGDFSVPGNHDLVLTINTANDLNPCNDTMTTVVTHVPLISSLPYSEDFEAGNGGWTSGGTGDWEYGVPAGGVINSSASCGGGTHAWVTNLDGQYSNSAMAYLVSPCFDFSAVTVDPAIKFDHIFEVETCCDESWLQISFNDGATWTTVGSFGTGANWYDDASNQWWDGASVGGNSGGWRTAGNILTGSAGQSSVKLRFVFSSDGSVTREGFGVDNVVIEDATNFANARPLGVTSPASDCNLSNAETIVADFTNTGTDTMFTFVVCYTMNGGSTLCDFVNDTLFPGQVYSHSFTTTADMSTVGAYDIELIIGGIVPDMSACDDTLTVTVEHKPTISTFPYLQKFDNGTGGWSANNSQNGTWALGTPNKTVINSAYSGNNSWVAGGLAGTYSDNDDSYVESPCFDFTNLPTGSWVAMAIWWECEFSWDGANLQFSVDGTNWQNVGAFGDPYNWYTDNTIGGSPGGSGEGWTGRNGSGSNGWVIAKHPLSDTLIGYTSVKFRVNFGSDGSGVDDGFAFDNFAIAVPPVVDLGNDTTVCENFILDPGYAGTHEWYVHDTSGATLPFLWSTNPSIMVENPNATDSTYDLEYVLVDTFGLMGMDTIRLTILDGPDKPDIVGALDTICINWTLTLNVATGYSSYSWTTGGNNATEDVIGTVIGSGPHEIVVTVSNINGCFNYDTVNVFVDPCTGIDEIQGLNFSIYPNPSSSGYFNYVHDAPSSDVRFELIDPTGKRILSWKSAGKGVIDLSTFERGLYFLKIDYMDETQTIRIIKQ